MLSNPTNALHSRQRQHRRQQSTPNVFEAVKASNLPTIQRHSSHRRGMSLDTRRRQSPPQDYMVSNTNTGYQTTQPQHTLRETQQQRLARPGQHFVQFDNDENYLHSPSVTPQRQSFDAGCTSSFGQHVSQSSYQLSGPINTIIGVDPNNYCGNNDFIPYQAETIMTPSAYLDFSAGFENASQGTSSASHSRRSSASRRISGGIIDRVTQFEHLALQSPCRPTTPNKNASHYFPPTPVETPHDRMMKQGQINQRLMDSYDTSMEETIKPRSNQRARGIFDDMRKTAEMNYMPSTPHVGLVVNPSNFDSAPMPTSNFMNMSNMHLEFMKNEQLDSPQFPPELNIISPAVSFHSSHNSSSPVVSQEALFCDPFVNRSSLDVTNILFAEPTVQGLPMSSSPSQQSRQSYQSSHRRSESVESINLEDSITDTGITIDDIANFISGPDASDGKWICLYPECKKRFGRKENIKSHVQTHLGDRQFQCPHCQKCFVRQHDLKRHAKIHSGVKPYPCQCGNSFARHDALTRHRQRGMCIGAFEGVVKKTVKRGRPRKNRPDTEERVNKASRTRSKNKAISSSSSTSGSENRGGQSPCSDLDVLDDKPFGDYEYSQQSQHGHQPTERVSFGLQQNRSSISSRGVSPHAIQPPHSPSRSVYSQHSHRGSISESTQFPSEPTSPAKSIRSMHSYHSQPGLCESSSSPTASIYYDVDTGSQNGDINNLNGLTNISEHEDEMFLEAFAAANSGTMTAEPDFSMSKFGDAYPNAEGVDLFSHSDDVFFCSP
ncbi:C2H2 transcription factor Swi5 [Diplocarpon rosae]|nr:C2H2 transcription factor Swi5 [Diplocarpon rosae]